MASWTQNKGSGLRHARCPVHGAMVVQTRLHEWVWCCADCIAEAARAMRRLMMRVV